MKGHSTETADTSPHRPWWFHALMALAAVGILAAAAYLRFQGLGRSQIGGDQSTLLRIALKFVTTGEIPLAANKSSAGIMNPPLLEYLIVLPLFVKPQIQSVVIFFALLNWCGVVACYVFLVRLYGYRVAFIATMLFAFNPFAVHYSRFIWNPNPIPFFSTLLLGSLLTYFAGKQRPVFLVLSFLWLAAVIQLHLASLVLIIVLGLILLLFRRLVSLRHVILGSVLFVLTFAPYLFFMQITGFIDIRATFNALGGSEATYNLASALIARDLVTGHQIFTIAGRGMEAWQAAVWPLHGLMTLEIGLLGAAIAYAGWRLLRSVRCGPTKAVTSFTILLLWLLLPIFLYVRHTIYLQNFYFLYLYPVPFVLIALAADDLLSRLRTRAQDRASRPLHLLRHATSMALVGAVVAIGAWQFHLFHTLLVLADEGLLSHRRQVADVDHLVAATRDVVSEHTGCGLIVISEGHSAETSSFGLLVNFDVADDIRYVRDGEGLIIPSNCAIYLDTTGGGWLTTILGDAARELPDAQVESSRETWRFYVKEADSYAVSCAEPLGEWEIGVRLCSREVRGAIERGQPIDLVYFWQVDRPTDRTLYHFYNHLIRLADGQLVSQKDGPGAHSPYWRAGDVFVTRFLVPMPADAAAGDYEIRTGIYTWPDLLRVPLDDGRDGLPVLSIDLGE